MGTRRRVRTDTANGVSQSRQTRGTGYCATVLATEGKRPAKRLGRRSALLAALLVALVSAPAHADRFERPITPVDGREEVEGSPLPATVRLSLPDGGRISSAESLWDSRYFRAAGRRCRVTLDLLVRASPARPREAAPLRFRRGGVLFHVSRTGLDDTRAVAGSAWFELPASVAPADPHRFVTVTVLARRGQDACIAPIRRRAAAIIRRALRSLALAPPGPQ